MKSRNILPLGERIDVDDLEFHEKVLTQYHKALETAELENTKLENKLSQCQLYNHSINTELQELKQVVKEQEEIIDLFQRDADERYEKAWKYINDYHGCNVKNSKYCETCSIDDTIKIAAYGKDE